MRRACSSTLTKTLTKWDCESVTNGEVLGWR